MTPATSRPKPAVPAARSTGFWKIVPSRAISLTGGPRGAQGRAAQAVLGARRPHWRGPSPGRAPGPPGPGAAGGGGGGPPPPGWGGPWPGIFGGEPPPRPNPGPFCPSGGAGGAPPAGAGARRASGGLARRREVRQDDRRRRDGADGPHSRALTLSAVGDETSRGIVARAGRGERTRGEETVAVREQDSRPRA